MSILVGRNVHRRVCAYISLGMYPARDSASSVPLDTSDKYETLVGTFNSFVNHVEKSTIVFNACASLFWRLVNGTMKENAICKKEATQLKVVDVYESTEEPMYTCSSFHVRETLSK